MKKNWIIMALCIVANTAVFYLDRSTPTTTRTAETAWLSTPATITLEATDLYSGVEGTYYLVGDATEPVRYSQPFTVSAEASAKSVRPMMRMRLRPNRSPSTPQVNSSEAKTSV